ncbi:MAG: NHL repeat-containing protein, partial [Verrucomicrobiae bacterium]|nr:NHL repeat-containing protein [Verrucomicrobiae bacterium]
MKLQLLIPIVLATAASAVAKTIPNHARANLVLGQPDFVTSTAPLVPGSSNLSAPTAVIVDPVTGKVFVADEGNARVLRYPNAASLKNGAGAEAVFGQPSFSSKTDSSGQQGLSNGLRGLFLDHKGRLWVGDRDNHRVLCFEAAVHRSSYPYADRVYGQPDFATTTSGTSSTKMDWPQGVWVDKQDRLWVADYRNDRVLRFDDISNKASGSAADGVLGQPDFNSGTSATTPTGMVGPVGVTVSANGTLFVGTLNRVLRYDDAASLANGSPADGVLGQPDLTSNTTGLSATFMNSPWGVFLTPDDTLWVMDSYSNRLLRFDKASSKPNGAAADGVVGQPDFVTANSGTDARTFGNGLYYFLSVDSSGNLWAPDYLNNRVLRFPPDVTKPGLVVKSVAKKVTKKKLKVSGTASDQYGVSKVQYKLGKGAVKTASGTISWSFNVKLAEGKNKLTVWSIDSVGNQSP